MRHRRSIGLGGHMAIIMVALVITLIAAAAVILLYSRAEGVQRVAALTLADRIVSIVETLEATPPEDRRRVLRMVSSPLMRVRWGPDKPPLPTQDVEDIDDIRALMQPYLAALGDRPVVMRASERPPRRFSPRPGLRPPPPDTLALFGPTRRGKRIDISVAVSEVAGGWVHFRTPMRAFRPPWQRGLATVIVAAAVIILIFAVWAAHRVTRPMVRFAEAADRLGMDVRAPPLPESGSWELRKAARAFNGMQERLRRLVDDRTLMLAAISHDLRTVLTRLKLRAEFIEDAQQQQKAVADIDEMQAMLDATLSFARDDTVEEPRTEVDLTSLLQSLCDDLADAGQAVDFQSSERLTFRCDPVAMRRAFLNLIGNAAKYGDAAQVTATGQDGQIQVEVSDRGPGVPEDMLERVFTPFFRVEQSRSRETGGTGLGLAVARSVIRRHGGDISLSNRAEGGLLVRVVLPRTGEP